MRRTLPSLGIIAAGITLTAMIFTTLRSLGSKNTAASFNGVAQERLNAVETNVRLTVNNLVSLGALYDASPNVGRPLNTAVRQVLVGHLGCGETKHLSGC